MYNTFVIKRGDTSPALRYQMPDETSLLGAQVQFQMRNAEGATVIDASAQIETDFNPAVVGYAWQANQTDTAGRNQAEFKVTYADGAIETFPNSGFITVIITEDVAAAE